ncbi:immunoglobulin-like domain-containing protein, partial [Pseudomonas costantinii]
ITKTDGGNFENLVTDPKAAVTTITDSVDNTTVTLSADKGTVLEGGDITYTATLTNPAQTAVTVTLSNGQTITIKAGESTGSVVFHTPA